MIPPAALHTLSALPAHLRAVRDLVERECPLTAANAIHRTALLALLASAEHAAELLVMLLPAPEPVEPRVPRFGAHEAAEPGRPAGSYPHP